jgi:hypothetical protein
VTREEALPLARKIAAAACELDNCSDNFCQFIRDGRMDNQREVKLALAAVEFMAEHIARQNRTSNVVEIAA